MRYLIVLTKLGRQFHASYFQCDLKLFLITLLVAKLCKRYGFSIIFIVKLKFYQQIHNIYQLLYIQIRYSFYFLIFIIKLITVFKNFSLLSNWPFFIIFNSNFNKIVKQIDQQLVKSKGMNRMHSYEEIKKISSQMKKSTSLEFIDHSRTHMDYLIGILKCPLCSGQVKQAHMCPTCCKLYCQLCIKNWIVYKKPQCPSCAKPLRYTSPINCQGLAKQIQDAISKTENQINSQSRLIQSPYDSKALSSVISTPEIYTQESRISINSVNSSVTPSCPQHDLKLEYYCQTCCVGVCSDCAVLSNKHSGHRLCKFSQKKLKLQQKISLIAKNIQLKRKQIIKKKEQKVELLERNNRIEQQRKQLLLGYLKRINDTVLNKLIFNIENKTKSQAQMMNKLERLQLELKKLESNISSEKKVSLLKKAISYQIEIRKYIYNQINPIKFKKELLQNQFCPSFGSQTFILDNYICLKQKGELIYSQPLFWKGIQWKLRIFPGGMEDQGGKLKDSEKYLAIYLEMSRGHQSPNLYKYEILLINQLDRSKAIGCAFENEFEQGTYWGLDKFANISFLQNQKFIHPVHGYLQIVLNVKSPSYFHAVKDQKQFIKQKETKVKQNNQILRQLRKRAGIKGFEKRKIYEESINVRSLIDSEKVRNKKLKKRRNSAG